MDQAEIERKRAYQREWYRKNRAQRLADNKAYRQKNSERIAARWKERYYSNIEDSRSKVRENKRRHESLQFIRPFSYSDPASIRQLQVRLGGGERGALTKSRGNGGRQRLREAVTVHVQLFSQTHDEWLEAIDLWRIAEKMEAAAEDL